MATRNPFVRAISKSAEAKGRSSEKSSESVDQSPVTPSGGAASQRLNEAVRERDPFDRVKEGRELTDGNVPNAVSDNNAETLDLGLQGGRQSSKKEVEVADSGVDADVKAGPRSRADEFGIGNSTSEGQSGQPGSAAAEVGSGGNQGAIDAVTGEINSAKEQERDVASELLGVPDISPGAGNEGSGQRLFDLQFASAELALANAQATETEPSVAVDGDPQTIAKEVGDILDKGSAVVSGFVTVAGIAGASPAAIAGSIGLGVGNAVGGIAAVGGAEAGITTAGFVAGAAAGTAAGVVIAGSLGFAAGTAAVKSGLADFSGAIDSAVSRGEATPEETEAKAEQARKEGAERKAQREKEEAERKAKEEEERKAKEEEERKAKEEKDKTGGVKTTPDDEQITKEEFLLGQQIKAELGQRRIAGDIDFGEGDGTNTGPKTEGNLSAADQIIRGGNETLVGQPGAGNEATRPRTGTVPGSPGFGGSDEGGDIDFEDGTGFTGGTRTEDVNDISFGPSAPLVGFPRDDDDDDGGKDDD